MYALNQRGSVVTREAAGEECLGIAGEESLVEDLPPGE